MWLHGDLHPLNILVHEGRIKGGRAGGPTRPEAADWTHEAAVGEPDPDAAPIPESGWFTREEVSRLPLAASARKTLEELLEVPLD